MNRAWDARKAELRERLDRAFGELDTALVLDAARASRRPDAEAWSVAEIAEHVVLTDHHILLLASKLVRKSRDRALRGEPIPARPPLHAVLPELERLASGDIRWDAPDHMLPSGTLALPTARRALREDRERCRVLLDTLPPGAGALASARFSPLDLRFDVYQFLALVALHAERHTRQARRVLARLEAGA